VAVQELLESSTAGRALISVFLVVTLLAIVVWNLPDSEIKRKSLTIVRPYITATSIDQNWGVFAPDPRRQTVDLLARVRFADGTEETLGVPRGDDVVGAYWDYRWWKWVEWARVDEHRVLWQPAALWFARRARTDGRRPVQVTLVRRSYDLLPPGDGPDRTDWQEDAYFTLRFTANGSGSGG
jgi:hypothetical protein